jgi:hypothetical protein
MLFAQVTLRAIDSPSIATAANIRASAWAALGDR